MVCFLLPDLCDYAAALIQEHAMAIYLTVFACFVGIAIATER